MYFSKNIKKILEKMKRFGRQRPQGWSAQDSCRRPSHNLNYFAVQENGESRFNLPEWHFAGIEDHSQLLVGNIVGNGDREKARNAGSVWMSSR